PTRLERLVEAAREEAPAVPHANDAAGGNGATAGESDTSADGPALHVAIPASHHALGDAKLDSDARAESDAELDDDHHIEAEAATSPISAPEVTGDTSATMKPVPT